jgi:hypothetical protein
VIEALSYGTRVPTDRERRRHETIGQNLRRRPFGRLVCGHSPFFSANEGDVRQAGAAKRDLGHGGLRGAVAVRF